MARLLKRVLALAAIAAVVGVVAFVTVSPMVQKEAAGRRAKAMADMPIPVIDAPARIADVPVYLNGVGTAKARNTVTVRAQVDGRIMSLKFKDGQDVKRGDVLALIDPATYQAQLEQAVAKKALDEAQLANAQRDLERYAKLTSLSVAEKTIDTQRALVAQLTAQIKLDDAAIANAKAFLDYTTIASPIDGRTGIRMVDEGNLVRATDAGIVVITEVRPISVMFTLPQQRLPEINKARAQGELAVEALETDSDDVLDKGTLQVIDNQVDQSTGTIRLKADFPNTELQLWPGQFVNVRLLLKTLDKVVVVPTAAVQRGPDNTYVYVIGSDNKVSVRPVTIAQQDEKEAVISDGLADKDRIVTAGFARLKQGAEVKVSVPGEDKPSAAAGGTPQANAASGAPSEETASINGAAATADPAAPAAGAHKHGGKGHHKHDATAAPSAPQ